MEAPWFNDAKTNKVLRDCIKIPVPAVFLAEPEVKTTFCLVQRSAAARRDGTELLRVPVAASKTTD
jgi:hypothetical protein